MLKSFYSKIIVLTLMATGIYFWCFSTPPVANNLSSDSLKIETQSRPQYLSSDSTSADLSLAVAPKLKEPEKEKISFSERERMPERKREHEREHDHERLPPTSKRKSWNFDNTDLDPQEMEASFKKGQPKQIVYYDKDRKVELTPKPGTTTNGQTLYLSNQQAVDFIRAQRIEEMENRQAQKESAQDKTASTASEPSANDEAQNPSADMSTLSLKKEIKKTSKNELEPDAYQIRKFTPGLRDDRVTTITTPADISSLIYGPDYSLNLDENGTSATTLSFGHGGSLILEVKNGVLQDKAGFDFVIYENVFRFGSGKLWQEFAQVGISEGPKPKNFKWFPCDPQQAVLKGCAGAVPTEEGGDQFDIGELGLKKVRFIIIKDTGNNFNMGPNKEGFDLDAARLNHAIIFK